MPYFYNLTNDTLRCNRVVDFILKKRLCIFYLFCKFLVMFGQAYNLYIYILYLSQIGPMDEIFYTDFAASL